MVAVGPSETFPIQTSEIDEKVVLVCLSESGNHCQFIDKNVGGEEGRGGGGGDGGGLYLSVPRWFLVTLQNAENKQQLGSFVP